MTNESTRELPLPCVDDSVPLPEDLDVTGGWGYTKERPCLLLDFGDEGAGVPCEYEFIPRRIGQELRLMADRVQFDDFRWALIRQRLVVDKAKGERFDVLDVHVSAVRKEDMAALDEVRSQHGDEGPEFEVARNRLAFVAAREFWFDLGMLGHPMV